VFPANILSTIRRAADGVGDSCLDRVGHFVGRTIAIEHPAGRIETRVEVDPAATAGDVVILRAGVVRTARLLLSGHVFVNVPAVLAAAA